LKNVCSTQTAIQVKQEQAGNYATSNGDMICIEHLKCCNLDLHVECASKNTAFIFLISNLYRNNCLLIIKIQQPEEVHYI